MAPQQHPWHNKVQNRSSSIIVKHNSHIEAQQKEPAPLGQENATTFEYPLSRYISLPHNNTAGLSKISKIHGISSQLKQTRRLDNELSEPGNGNFVDQRFNTLDAISIKKEGLSRDQSDSYPARAAKPYLNLPLACESEIAFNSIANIMTPPSRRNSPFQDMAQGMPAYLQDSINESEQRYEINRYPFNLSVSSPNSKMLLSNHQPKQRLELDQCTKKTLSD